MKPIIIRTLSVFLAGVILLFGLPTSVPVSAASVYIDLSGPGATSWAINSVYPGASGSKVVNLKNTSSENASVRIWVNSIVSTENTPARFQVGGTGDLVNNLVLQISGTGLVADNFNMPSVIANFPQNATDAESLTIASLGAGETVTLTWQWALPVTAGNENQGDGVTFDINYQLTGNVASGGGGGSPIITPTPTATSATPSIPQPTPGVPAPAHPVDSNGQRIIELDVLQSGDSSTLTSNGVINSGLSASSPDGNFTLSIEAGTQIQLSNENRADAVNFNNLGDNLTWKIKVNTLDTALVPPYPDGWIAVSPNYDINGITNKVAHGLKMDRPSSLVIKYDETLLPEIVDALAVFYYNFEEDWTELSPPAGFIAEGPEVAAQVDHFSLFVVLAKPGAGKPPANILIQRLTVSPERILVGQSADVRVRVINKGGLPGEYVVVIKVDGKIQKSQSVHLNPGQSKEVDMILMPGVSGIYSVTTGQLGDDLVVDPRIIPDVSETNYWWLLCIAAGIATMIISLFRLKEKQTQEIAVVEEAAEK